MLSPTTIGTTVFVISRDSAGLYRWTLFADGKGIADSGESYATHSDANEAAKRVQRLAPVAVIKDE